MCQKSKHALVKAFLNLELCAREAKGGPASKGAHGKELEPEMQVGFQVQACERFARGSNDNLFAHELG